MTTLEITEFRQSIIEFTNTKNFPLEVKRLVFADILRELTESTKEELKFEIAEIERAKKANNSKSTKGDNE